jgi:WD40 repeat protein
VALQVHLEHTFSGHQASVFALGSAPDEQSVLSGCGDGLVVSWPLRGEQAGTALGLARLPANVFSLCWLPKAQQLLVGGLHGGVHLLDYSSPQGKGRELRNLGDNRSAVFRILTMPGSGEVWMARGDGVLSAWDSRDWSLLWQRRLSTERLRDIAPEPGGGRVAVSSSDGRVYLVEKQGGALLQVLEGHLSSVFCSAWSPDGRWLVSGSRDARLRLWDNSRDLALDTVIPAHLFTVNHLLFEPSGRWLISASRDKTIKVWSARDFQLLKVLERPRFDAHTRSVNALHWNSASSRLISASDDRQIKVWHLVEEPDQPSK